MMFFSEASFLAQRRDLLVQRCRLQLMALFKDKTKQTCAMANSFKLYQLVFGLSSLKHLVSHRLLFLPPLTAFYTQHPHLLVIYSFLLSFQFSSI